MGPIEKTRSTEDLKSRALDISGLVQYQGGAIVSREILRKSGGTVSVFAFGKEEALSEHTAPFDAMVISLDGEAEITIGGKSHIIRHGEMIIMPENVPHSLRALTPFKMLLIMIQK